MLLEHSVIYVYVNSFGFPSRFLNCSHLCVFEKTNNKIILQLQLKFVSIIINYGASKTAFLRSATQFVACDLSGVNARKYILRALKITGREAEPLKFTKF